VGCGRVVRQRPTPCAAESENWGGVHGLGDWGHMSADLADLRVRISFFHAREQISIGFGVTPAPMPAGRDTDAYPHPSGFISAGTQIFCTH
jgi:hypothetical protein